jgi:hypothetical protein
MEKLRLYMFAIALKFKMFRDLCDPPDVSYAQCFHKSEYFI